MSSALWCVTNGRASGAAVQRLQHRRLHLEEAEVIEMKTDGARQHRAGTMNSARTSGCTARSA
jgi:hypothetical protein